jgi:uncharacterized membrane protein
MLCALLGIAHLVLLWSPFLSKLLLLIDCIVLLTLAFGAFKHAEEMRRHHLPFIGEFANRFVEEE